MADATCSRSASPPAKKQKRTKSDFDRGKARDTPCGPCVEKQLKTFDKGGWENASACCDQKTKNGNAIACYQCRVDHSQCKQLGVSGVAIDAWAAIQRSPKKCNEDEALDAAFEVKLRLLQSSVAISAVQQGYCESLQREADSICGTARFLEHLGRKYFGYVDDDSAATSTGIPGQHTHLDPDDRAKLDRLSECRKLEDAQLLTAKIIEAASVEANSYRDIAMRKL